MGPEDDHVYEEWRQRTGLGKINPKKVNPSDEDSGSKESEPANKDKLEIQF